jgi:glyoxylase-like metal-dependent hydrolase (beta-lactamase superfamily II)
LIDTGAGKAIRDLRNSLDLILNSHWHEDHIACNGLLNAKIGIHELDAEAAEFFNEFKRRYGLPEELVNLFIELWFDEMFRDVAFSKADVRFGDGDEFELGKTSVRVIHTSGHSAGHSCFLIQDGDFKIVYLGDIDLTSFGPWYGCLDCDVEEFAKSIVRLVKIVDDEEVELAVSSHKGVISGKEGIMGGLRSYLEKIQERENRIMELLSSEQTSDSLVGKGIVYRKLPEPQDIFRHFERTMVEKHLESLVKKGKVARLRDGFVRI